VSDGAETVFRLRPDVRFRRVRDEALVLRQGDAEVLGLNELGARVLELVAEGCSLAAMVDRIAAEYEVCRDRLRRDLEAFLAELADNRVVEVATGGESGGASS